MSAGNIDFFEFTPAGVSPLSDVAIQLHPQDQVVIAKANLQAGTRLVLDDERQITVRGFIPAGHKIALMGVASGDPIRRYGQIIGFATQAVQPGDHVHTHNLSVQDFNRDYAFGVDVKPVSYEDVVNIIEHELGGKLNKFFKTFRPQPLGSASIGQVHFAVQICPCREFARPGCPKTKPQ